MILPGLPDIDPADIGIRRKASKSTRLKRQWSACAAHHTEHLANHDHVVSARMQVVHAAIEPAQSVCYPRRVWARPPMVIHVKLLTPPPRKVQCKVALLVAKDMHGESCARYERANAATRIRKTPQQQGRLEGNGRERVRRYPDGLPVRSDCSNDGYTRGEHAERIA